MKIRLSSLIFVLSALFYCQSYAQDSQWTVYTSLNGLGENNVRAIGEDLQGTMWFGTMGTHSSGVSSFDGTSWKNYTTVDGLASNNVSAVAIDSSGNVWCGTYNNGVSKFNGTTWTTYTTANGLAHPYVNAIEVDQQGNVWFATDNGVSKFNGTTWITYTTANGLSKNHADDIAIDGQGNVWVCNYEQVGGVSRFDGTSWTNYTTADGLADSNVHTLATDSHGNVWCGTNSGVSKFDGTNWTNYSTGSGHPVMAIAVDSKDNVWIGYQGLSRFDGIDWTFYANPVEAITSNSSLANSIFIDSFGNVWYGSGDSEKGVGKLGIGTGGQSSEPEIVLSTTSVSIGDVAVGSSGTGTFKISNLGDANLVVSSIASDNSVFVVSSASATIAAGDSLPVTVSFTPTAAGSQTAMITVISNDSDEGTLTVNVSGTAVPVDTTVVQGITFVSIPGGTFQMGQTGVATPVHQVTVSAFQMGRYEITQSQYQAVVGSNPSEFTGDTKRPVDRVSWYDAVTFCNKLSKLAGLDTCYNLTTWACDITKNGYRLATEAEWEYACRAGTTTNYYTGDTESDLAKAGWYSGNSGNTTHPVGGKQANGFGLYDMHGNVWEWCNDWYGSYSSASQTDPVGPSSGSERVGRSGRWDSAAADCRSANRYTRAPNNGDHGMGFRVVRRGGAIPEPTTHFLQGSILSSGSGLSGVSVHVTSSGVDTTLTTGSGGSYSLSGLANGAYTITPSKSGYTFSPASAQVTISGVDITIPAIVATYIPPVPVVHLIQGSILENGTGLVDISLHVTGTAWTLSLRVARTAATACPVSPMAYIPSSRQKRDTISARTA